MSDGPRIPPRPEADWDDKTREVLAAFGDRPLNIFTTLAHHPDLLKRWLVFGSGLLGKGLLGARERELLILRTGWNCGSEYEFGQHVLFARDAGLDDDDIRRVVEGADAGWEPRDKALLYAADELHEHQVVSNATWTALSEHYDAAELIEILMVVGQYHLVSMLLRSCGVELDEGVPRCADLDLPPGCR